MFSGTGSRPSAGRGWQGSGLLWPTVGYWPKHPRKDLEMLLIDFDRSGWRIERAKKYYRVKCACGDHKRMIHISPSGANYATDVRQWLKRTKCIRPSSEEDT